VYIEPEIKSLHGNTRSGSGAKARFMPPETIPQGPSVAHLDIEAAHQATDRRPDEPNGTQ
jgi:hypothetical protein